MSSLDKQTVQSKIITLIAEQLGVEENTITTESTLEQLGADSLDIVELIMKMEECFSIEISDEEAEQLKTVGQVASYIADKVSSSSP